MAQKPVLTARVPRSLYEMVDAYSEVHDLSKSEAVNELLDTGLIAETTDKYNRGCS